MDTSAAIRAELGHPVIDADGHVQEYLPAVMPYLRESLGPKLFQEYITKPSPMHQIIGGDDAGHRRRTQVPQSTWWGTPARNTRDLATAALPRLLHQRLDEFGIDFAVLYPTKGLGVAGIDHDELRRGVCRGFNDFYADVYGPYADRLTVGGIIPMHTPAEAVAEIEHCRQIGLKVVGLPEGVLRPIEEPGRASPWLLPGQGYWFDTFGVDSAYDYDPVWAMLQESRFAATCHGGIGHLAPFTYTSITNYVFNHIGSFAQRMHKLCKSLFLGGVTHRFPELNIAFLECGVGWACSLLVDIVEHWEKRNIDAMRANLDPALVDLDELEQLFRAYGPELLERVEGDVRSTLAQLPAVGVLPPDLDEFGAAGITSKGDIYTRFVPRFYFGCEADDRTIAFAFSEANAFGARLQAIFSSDISHWDVESMADVVAEAHSLVRKGVLTEEHFADFVFHNPYRLFTGNNPDFFVGTVIEAHAPAPGVRALS